METFLNDAIPDIYQESTGEEETFEDAQRAASDASA